MPAYKDTKHPPGQIVNGDKEQGSLSNYIRSIRRAQAFDDVAAEKKLVAESAPKLTFEEWFNKKFGYDSYKYIHNRIFTKTELTDLWKAAQENK